MSVTTERADQVTRDGNAGRVADREDAVTSDRHVTWVRKLGERPTTEQPTIARDDSEVLGRPGNLDQAVTARRDLRPRASVLASIALFFGVVAALAVLSGMLVAPGVAAGVVAALFAFGGISAASRWSVVGRFDAIIGLLFGIGAIVIGVLSLTHNLSWLPPGTNQLTMLHDWLAAHASWALLS